jgi:hypothetical protein
MRTLPGSSYGKMVLMDSESISGGGGLRQAAARREARPSRQRTFVKFALATLLEDLHIEIVAYLHKSQGCQFDHTACHSDHPSIGAGKT